LDIKFFSLCVQLCCRQDIAHTHTVAKGTPKWIILSSVASKSYPHTRTKGPTHYCCLVLFNGHLLTVYTYVKRQSFVLNHPLFPTCYKFIACNKNSPLIAPAHLIESLSRISPQCALDHRNCFGKFT